MAKKIEINNLNYNGDYEIMYPKTIPEMVENLLLKDTKALIGFEEIATPNDMFRKLILGCKSVCYLTFVDSTNQTPIENLEVFCDLFCDASGTAMTSYTTDADGKITAFVSNINPTIKISGYADVVDFSQTLEVDALGKEFEWVIPLTTRNFIKYTSTTSARFTSNVTKVNVTAVGGGGGGGHNKTWSSGGGRQTINTGGGGGGGYCTVKEDVDFVVNTIYSVTVGAGGAVDVSGGTSSFLGVSANGGSNGGQGSSGGGAGNGRGGHGVYFDETENDARAVGGNGIAGSVAGYSSFTETVIYGGGGGGGSGGSFSVGGVGAGYGGNGSAVELRTEYQGTVGADGFGGGGGGAGGYVYSNDFELCNGTKGGSGCIAIRMYLKSQGY